MKEVYVALITPFNTNNEIDYITLGFIIEDLIHDKVDGFIVNGTTGESSTLTEDEKFTLLEFVIKQVKHRVKIFFGCGTNNTNLTLYMSKKALNYDIDAILLVTPYYNKPTQNGLYEHFKCIANNVDIPIVLYQVENRCNCIIEIETLDKLTRECKNIVGFKYASKNIEYAKLIRKKLPNIKLYIGDDLLIKESEKIGFDGIISVIGHITMKELRLFYDKQDYEYDYYLKRIANFAFIETNPIGIKYIISKKYHSSDTLRLPLTTLTMANKQYLDSYFDNI